MSQFAHGYDSQVWIRISQPTWTRQAGWKWSGPKFKMKLPTYPKDGNQTVRSSQDKVHSGINTLLLHSNFLPKPPFRVFNLVSSIFLSLSSFFFFHFSSFLHFFLFFFLFCLFSFFHFCSFSFSCSNFCLGHPFGFLAQGAFQGWESLTCLGWLAVRSLSHLNLREWLL